MNNKFTAIMHSITSLCPKLEKVTLEKCRVPQPKVDQNCGKSFNVDESHTTTQSCLFTVDYDTN